MYFSKQKIKEIFSNYLFNLKNICSILEARSKASTVQNDKQNL